MKNDKPQNGLDHVFVRLCAEAGIKATHQRREIYRALAGSRSHPDADELYRQVRQRVPSVSLDTVYRNLRAMEEYGIIRRTGAGGPRVRYDANTKNHHHFTCCQCGAIKDFVCPDFDVLDLPRKVHDFGDISFVQVQLSGVCRECAGSKTEKLARKNNKKT